MTDQLNLQAIRHLSEIKEVTIAVCFMEGGLGGGHVGILFTDKENSLKMLHLAWHHQLRCDDIEQAHEIEIPKWIAVILDIPPLALKQVIADARALSKRLPPIPYGIAAKEATGSFRASGIYQCPPKSDGLTCATFVSTFLGDLAVPLIKVETWEESEANKAWGEKVLCCLKNYSNADEAHLLKVASNINGIRVLPAEVIGAALLLHPDRPANFALAQSLATRVNNAYQQIVGSDGL